MNIINVIDKINDFLGKVAITSSTIIIFIQFVVVLLRYVFSINYVWLQESIMYGFSIMFLLSSALVYKENSHVRIDILHGKMGEKKQSIIEIFGILFFLFPTGLFLTIFSWDYVVDSWAIMEKSNEATGIPFLYLLKTLIIIFAIQLLLQAISNLYKSCLKYNGQ